MWGDSKYDPTLAVLTATLVSLVWYTYFTYRVVTNAPPTMLDFGLSYQRQPATLSLSIQNQQRHHVSCVVTFAICSRNGEWELPPPYKGMEADRFHLKPGEAFHGSLAIHTEVESLPPESRSVLVTAHASWQDETGDDGCAGPKSWVVDVESQSIRRLFSDSEVRVERQRITGAA